MGGADTTAITSILIVVCVKVEVCGLCGIGKLSALAVHFPMTAIGIGFIILFILCEILIWV